MKTVSLCCGSGDKMRDKNDGSGAHEIDACIRFETFDCFFLPPVHVFGWRITRLRILALIIFLKLRYHKIEVVIRTAWCHWKFCLGIHFKTAVSALL